MEWLSTVADMVRSAERHADDLSADRIRAVEYYRGEMRDTPSDVGRSSITTRDIRSAIKKALPSVYRTILGSDEVVEYQPVGPGDEDAASQASDYVNYVVMGASGARKAIKDAIHDAMLLRNGILHWWWDERQSVTFSRHTGLDEAAIAALDADGDVEIIEAVQRDEDVGGVIIPVYDVKVRRSIVARDVKVAAVPRERFLIHADAVSLDDALIVGERAELRRSDLVAMGYDRDLVAGLAVTDEDDEDSDRRGWVAESDGDEAPENETLDYYDLYVRIDADGDGIAELRHMCFAGGLTERNLLVDEECDEIQYCDIKVMSQPHQWEGVSLADDLFDIQRVKTVLTRATLDNLYWQNNLQRSAQDGAVLNMDEVLNPRFGGVVRVARGVPVNDALGVVTVPFVARESFGMIEYIDREATDRTGISDASSGLAPDALQNVTAKATALIEQGGIGQTEMMVREIADGLRVFFGGLLRLIVRHQDMSRTVRLRNEWVEFDPRQWNAMMDCTVNTGLGAGTRERDMMVMQQVLGLQERMLSGFGPDNPFVKPENVYSALSRMIEAAGLKTPSLYFTEPDPQEVQQKMEAARNQPNLVQLRVQAQMQLEQAKMQANRDKEAAQMEADLRVEQARIAAETERQRNDLASRALLQRQQIEWEREKFAAEIAAREAEAERARMHDIQRAQAVGFGKLIEGMGHG